MAKKTPIFEHKTCGRCGGSGNYSYCQMHGTTCFKCGGTGLELTRRGYAAQAHYRALLSVTLGDLSLGDVVLFEDIGRSYWIKINEIRRGNESRTIELNGDRMAGWLEVGGVSFSGKTGGWVAPAASKVRKKHPAEVLQAARAAALAFEATLTKAGTPRKSRNIIDASA